MLIKMYTLLRYVTITVVLSLFIDNNYVFLVVKSLSIKSL